MSFLEGMKRNQEMSQKAAAYDNMMKEKEQRGIYERGLADKEREISNYFQAQAQQAYAQSPGADIQSGEIQEAMRLGVQDPSPEDIYALRKVRQSQQEQGLAQSAGGM